jgi:hypothetical protein
VSWIGLADLGLDFLALLVRSRISQLLVQLLPLCIALPPAAYLSIAFPHSLVSSPRKQTCLCSLVRTQARPECTIVSAPCLAVKRPDEKWTVCDGFCSFSKFDIISAYAYRVVRVGVLSARQSYC